MGRYEESSMRNWPSSAKLSKILAILSLTLLFQASPLAARPTFVLVHGAWVGEWYWDPIVERLSATGFDVVAVSLTGHGLRASEQGAHVTIQDHARDIVETIEAVDQGSIILVAHSYGGRPATAAWDLARDRIAHLVYLEAVAPVSETGPVVIPASKRALTSLMLARPGLLDIGMLPVPARLRDKWGDRPQPHSLSSLYGEVILSEGPLPPTPGTYVLGLQSKAKVFREFANVLHSQRGWDVVKLDSAHDFVSDAPDALALFLTEIADQHADY